MEASKVGPINLTMVLFIVRLLTCTMTEPYLLAEN